MTVWENHGKFASAKARLVKTWPGATYGCEAEMNLEEDEE